MSENILSNFLNALPTLQNASFSQANIWLNLTSKTICTILHEIRQPTVNIGVYNELQTILIHMKRIHREILDLSKDRGAEQYRNSRIKIKLHLFNRLLGLKKLLI